MPHSLDVTLRAHAARAAGVSPDDAWQVEPMVGQASNRTYHRIHLPDRRLVAMVMPKDAAPEEVTAGADSAELPFVNVHRYLDRLGLRVPRIFDWDPEAGILILEDLGEKTLEVGLTEGDPEERREALYGGAVDLLATMRARADANPDPACIAFGRSFDFELYRWEFDHFLEWGLTALHGVELQGTEAVRVFELGDEISRALHQLPRGFTHRDYQSRNLMVLPGDELAILDFQDALLGPLQYDLVALLRDSYVELPMDFVEKMVRRYLNRLVAEGGPRLDPEPFLADFHLLTVQRKLKDAGRFVFIDRVKGNPSFLPAIPASLRCVREALERVPSLGDLQAILSRYVPELA